MSIRAKFKCSSVEKFEGAEKVNLGAVTSGGSKVNEQWSKWTPSGSLMLHISNPAAHGFFEPGKEYLLDVREAEPGE